MTKVPFYTWSFHGGFGESVLLGVAATTGTLANLLSLQMASQIREPFSPLLCLLINTIEISVSRRFRSTNICDKRTSRDSTVSGSIYERKDHKLFTPTPWRLTLIPIAWVATSTLTQKLPVGFCIQDDVEFGKRAENWLHTSESHALKFKCTFLIWWTLFWATTYPPDVPRTPSPEVIRT